MAVAEDPPATIPEWIITFGDMMALLLTFFIMLVSMSEFKSENRVAEAVQALKRRFGKDAILAPGAVKHRGAQIDAPKGPKPRVKGIRPGHHVLIGGAVYFQEETSQLTDKTRKQLLDVVKEVRGKPQKIEIRGHTTRRPLAAEAPFDDHWHLAYARCHQVLAFLVSKGIDPRRIRLGVAAGNEPAHVGRDPALRKENSRVEVFMLGEVVKDFDSAVDGKAAEASIIAED